MRCPFPGCEYKPPSLLNCVGDWNFKLNEDQKSLILAAHVSGHNAERTRILEGIKSYTRIKSHSVKFVAEDEEVWFEWHLLKGIITPIPLKPARASQEEKVKR